MGKKVQLKKYLKFAPLFLVLLYGCATTGGSLGPEVRVNNAGKVPGTNKSPGEVLRCQHPKLAICKQFGATKYCSCQHAGSVNMPRF